MDWYLQTLNVHVYVRFEPEFSSNLVIFFLCFVLQKSEFQIVAELIPTEFDGSGNEKLEGTSKGITGYMTPDKQDVSSFSTDASFLVHQNVLSRQVPNNLAFTELHMNLWYFFQRRQV